MLKPHKDLNTSQKKGGSFMHLLKRSLKDLAKEDQNRTPMSSNGSSPHKQIDSSKAFIPTPPKSLHEPSIASSPNNILINPILEDPIQSSSPSYPRLIHCKILITLPCKLKSSFIECLLNMS